MALRIKERAHCKSSGKNAEEIEGPMNSRILVQLDITGLMEKPGAVFSPSPREPE